MSSETWLIRYGGYLLVVAGVLVGAYGVTSTQAGLVIAGVVVLILGVVLPRLEGPVKANLLQGFEGNLIRSVDLERELVSQAEAKYGSTPRAAIEQLAREEVQRLLPTGTEMLVQKEHAPMTGLHAAASSSASIDLATQVRSNLAAMILRDRTECGDCHAILDEPGDLTADERKPCPNCGSLRRSFVRHVSDSIRLSDHVTSSPADPEPS